MHSKEFVVLQTINYFVGDHSIQFTRTATQLIVIDIIDQVNHFIYMGGTNGPIKLDILIDVVICIILAEIYE
jgi:hypothetical protein